MTFNIEKGQQRNIPRILAMYLCQTVGDVKLDGIKVYYSVGYVGTVSQPIQEVKSLLEGEKNVKILYQKVIDYLNVKNRGQPLAVSCQQGERK